MNHEPYLPWQMPPRVPLLIAVTGHRDMHPDARPKLAESLEKQFQGLLDHLPNTPLRVLCGMAQGADLLVAETALRLAEKFPRRITVLPILPCPPPLFTEKFISLAPGAPKDQRDEEAIELFNRLLERCEDWQLAPAFARVRQSPLGDRPSLPAKDDDAAWSLLLCDDDSRHRRYQEVGAAMALFGQMTFALWDGAPSEKVGGTDEVVAWCLSLVAENVYPQGLERLGGPPQTALLRFHTPRLGSADLSGAGIVEWRWPVVGNQQVIAPGATSFLRELSKRFSALWALRRPEYHKHNLFTTVISCALEGGRTVVDWWAAWNDAIAWNTRRPREAHASVLHNFEGLNAGLSRHDPESKTKSGASKSGGPIVEQTPNASAPPRPSERKSGDPIEDGTPNEVESQALNRHFGAKLVDRVSSRLRALAILRTRVTAILYPHVSHLQWWVSGIFVAIGLAAFCGHTYSSHLHIEDGGLHYGPIWLAGFVGITALAWKLGWILHACHLEPRTHDLRAVAEALRVQIFWALGGLSDSVAASYRQRQRGEFQWIRAAVRGVALPYDVDAADFRACSHAEKIERLRVVRENWIDDQRAYFLLRFRQYRDYLLLTKWLGLALALGGWCLAVFILVFHQAHPSLAQIVVLAAFLIVGSALIAYSENRRFPELAFRDERMHRVYDGALERFDRLIAEAEAATETQRQAECILHLQTLIRSLGRESLDENADWLTLHRARPFEPPVH